LPLVAGFLRPALSERKLKKLTRKKGGPDDPERERVGNSGMRQPWKQSEKGQRVRTEL